MSTELRGFMPLSPAESAVVAEAMPRLRLVLGRRQFRGFVTALGPERCYDAGTSAFMRAVKSWDSSLSCFITYASIWLRKYLIAALSEAAATGDVILPDSIVCDGPLPDEQAERIELIAAAFRVLPQRQREVIMLRSTGLTWPEVAEAMSCSLTLVRRYHVSSMTRLWKFAPELRSA